MFKLKTGMGNDDFMVEINKFGPLDDTYLFSELEYKIEKDPEFLGKLLSFVDKYMETRGRYVFVS